MKNYEFTTINPKAKKYMDFLYSDFKNYSEMTVNETEFLTSLILDIKPKKILELGVSSGTSSVAILNAIRNYGAKLYSIDLNTNWYKDEKCKTGWYANKYGDLLQKWKLYTGDLAYKFMGEIGNDIDFCLIDTVHCNPGEILDFLMVFPYLKSNAIIVFHDTALHTKITQVDGIEFRYTNNLLMSSIHGKKYYNLILFKMKKELIFLILEL